jgi:energy-coupling factor transporter ATP-binding protein EcfA2
MINLSIKFDEDYIIETTYDFSPIRKNTFIKKSKDEITDRDLQNKINAKSKELGLTFGRQATLTKAERFHIVEHEYKILYKKDSEFILKDGINLLVGDNGCGKSTLIRLLIKANLENLKGLIVYNVDMEKTNPNISKPDPDNGTTHSPQQISNMFMWSVESHGETREGVLAGVLSNEFDMLILDEPEQGLSLRNQLKYLNKLKETGKPIIISTHSKTFIENVDEVFDVETMKWVNSNEYLNNINN